MKKPIFFFYFFSFSLTFSQINVNVDFNKSTDFPLSKNKVGGVYQTPWISTEWIERDIPKLSELESRSMRYEIAWGQRSYGNEMVTKNEDGTLNFDFSSMDLFTGIVSQQNSNVVMSHSYNPLITGGGRRGVDPPNDYQLYKEINKRFAQRWKELKLQNHFVEIWNEPDNAPAFFAESATIEDYYEIYKYASEGVLEANPDAKIGGTAAAWSEWHIPFVKKCTECNFPLHYLSGHNYGDPVPQLNSMREALILGNRPDVEILMTEYSPYIPWIGETWGGGLQERFEAAMTFFNAAEIFLTYPDLTYVHWAQYIDGSRNGAPIPVDRKGDKMGLIDGNDGKRKALFNAFKVYGMMPVDRFELTSSEPFIKGFASSDPNNAGIVLWNTSRLRQEVKIAVNNLPFSSGEAKLYRIDRWNSWWETRNDSLRVLQTHEINSNKFSWTGSIPELSVIFLKFDDLTGKTELAANPFAFVIKTHHWFENREAPTYADFDFKTWITRLGMGDEQKGDAVIGVYAENIPAQFKVKFIFSGNEPQKLDENSTVNFRIDFQNKQGKYVKSVLFHGGLYDPKRSNKINWGTKEPANEIVKVDLSDFTVNLKKHAPSGWNGKAVLTYQMQNTGANSRVKVFVKE